MTSWIVVVLFCHVVLPHHQTACLMATVLASYMAVMSRWPCFLAIVFFRTMSSLPSWPGCSTASVASVTSWLQPTHGRISHVVPQRYVRVFVCLCVSVSVCACCRCARTVYVCVCVCVLGSAVGKGGVFCFCVALG